MNKLKDILLKSKYELSLFVVLCMNFLLFFTKDNLMSDILYPLHLVDLKIGFISRTLVGTVTGLLWEHPTKDNVFFLHTAVTVLTFFLTALFLGKCIKNADKENGSNLFIISLIIAVFPYGFMTYINLFELLDIYWVLVAALCLLASNGNKASFLIPVFIIVGLWAHFSFVFAFMPLIYILCFYKCIKEKNRLTYALTAFMIAVSIPATLYFLMTNRSFNVIPFEEFIDYIIAKAGDKITNIERYVGTGFRPYDEMYKVYDIYDIDENSSLFSKMVSGYFIMSMRDTSLKGIIADLILASPAVIFFEAVWKSSVKMTADKKEKFVYFLCIISPLIQVIALFTSSDTSRWLSVMMISNLFLLALFVKEKDYAVTTALNDIMNKLKKYKLPLLFVLFFYLTIVFVW